MQLPTLIVADVQLRCALVIGDPDTSARALLGEEAQVVEVPDRSRLTERLDDVVGAGASVDLVIDGDDDAARARATFEVLFRHVSPDGLYVIEGPVDEQLVLQLALATVRSPTAIAALSVLADGVAVRRGPGPVADDAPLLAHLWSDPFGLLRS